MAHYDFCVIGAGIVGLATAAAILRRRPGADLLLLDKEHGVARHQSGHNSGVIHSGIYYAPGSRKAVFSKEGAARTKEFCDRHGIAWQQRGKLLVATTPVEEERMRGLGERAALHGIEARTLSAAQLRDREPNIEGSGALYVPATAIVDYRQVSEVLARVVADAGADLRFGAAVRGIRESRTRVEIVAEQGLNSCDALVVCAGLQADRLARMAGVTTDIRIVPFRGEYFRLPAGKSDFVRHLVYPVPDPALPFLGVHLSPTLRGEVTVGPNAVLGLAREGYPKFSVSLRDTWEVAAFPGTWRLARSAIGAGAREMRNSLSRTSYLRECRAYAPSLTRHDLLPHGAGIRAQAVRRDGTLVHDFEIAESARMMHVLNAPSPAATAALPIGAHLAERAVAKREQP
ncbi:L-2-hydroxyglutarate oxidase [Nocardiopsis ansamitocini]|uniref:Hydroxyglutarate oxidase n=1 Tax=Nocardiopsis ansamitocini TaxID=1670832 RepID=A0A9W6UGQ8_9ACTN|nr:L-2-hydroxyglutarate oxidase [Nocardiopsis ansamitocini]GLU45679.1 hydroxyglutarate oxidase [Nocardiopsis ansamitocini]